MLYRRRILLGLLESLGGSVGLRDYQKHLFLFTQLQSSAAFEFVPYHYGCYSFTAEADRQALIRQGFLCNEETWSWSADYSSSSLKSRPFSHTLSQEDQLSLVEHQAQMGHLRGRELIRAVYLHYPYYATRSQIAKEHCSLEELIRIQKCRPPPKQGPALFTIGYEGKSLESYLCELLDQRINILCDVRRNPVSRKPGFSKTKLQHALKGLEIEYCHYPELGIPSPKRRNLKPEHYGQLFSEYERETLPERIDDLKAILDMLVHRRRVALTCFERHPNQCHRSYLAKTLKERFEWRQLQSLNLENL